MLELLKKLGVPSAVAAIVATIVTITPFLFKIDERYAKEEFVKSEVAELRKENQRLQKELAEMVGTVNTMTTFIIQGRFPVGPASPAPTTNSVQPPVALAPPAPPLQVRPPAPVIAEANQPAPPPPPPAEAPARNWGELRNRLEEQKTRLRD